ncbi:MAG: hypothetical protein ACOCVP_02860 [Wenzhouxiangella sp.]
MFQRAVELAPADPRLKTAWNDVDFAAVGLWACLVVAPAGAQPADRQQCPPQCGVRIDVPANQNQEPDSSPVTLEVEAGETVSFSTNVRARVIFTGATPFIDERGNRVFQFQVGDSGQTRLRVSAASECSAEPGCKYMIVDATNPGRPARDPYILVRR